MLICGGLPWTAIIKVKNNTDEVVKSIEIIYNGDKGSKIKNIKPSENKQTGVSTIYNVKNLKMKVNGIEKEYLLKSSIPSGNVDIYTIIINNITSTECEYEILDGDHIV